MEPTVKTREETKHNHNRWDEEKDIDNDDHIEIEEKSLVDLVKERHNSHLAYVHN